MDAELAKGKEDLAKGKAELAKLDAESQQFDQIIAMLPKDEVKRALNLELTNTEQIPPCRAMDGAKAPKPADSQSAPEPPWHLSQTQEEGRHGLRLARCLQIRRHL